MKYLFYGIASWLLLPVALFQGLRLRARTARLEPPAGRPFGQVGTASSPCYSILVIGDSSAAGVGADHVEDTVGCRIAHILSETTGCTVAWRNAGSNSAISAQLRDHVVPNLERLPHTHILLTVGTNDMKNFLTARKFKRGFGGLLYAVRSKWPEAQILWSPMIDMRTVPAFPVLLAHIMEMRGRIINRVGRQLCRERHAIAAPQLDSTNPLGFSVDGFHASAAGYRSWAELLARTILDHEAGVPGSSATKAAE
jgi:lysophospholipase L1-like esterase